MWTENQAPFESGLYWPEEFSDCNCSDVPEDLPENGKCPLWEGMEIAECPKHGQYVKRYGCPGCETEDYENILKMEEEPY